MSNESKEYYMALAEMHAFDYDTELMPSNDILAVYGVVYQMQSEVMLHTRKSGSNEKSKLRVDGLKLILDYLDKCNSCYSRNHQYRILLKRSMVERSGLEKKIEDLQKQLENIEKAFNEI